MTTLFLPTDNVVFIDDITQTMTIRMGGLELKAFYPPTHYACPEMGSGSDLKDHFDLSNPGIKRLMSTTDGVDVLCDHVCKNRCGKPKHVGEEL